MAEKLPAVASPADPGPHAPTACPRPQGARVTAERHSAHPCPTGDRVPCSYLPALLTNPMSARTPWQRSQRKHSGCQLLFMALITRPMMNSPAERSTRVAAQLPRPQPPAEHLPLSPRVRLPHKALR